MSHRDDTIRSAELATNDLMPECHRCRELNAAGATTCADCGAHLFVRSARKQPLVLLPDAPEELCPTDLHAYDIDGFCDCCGRQRRAA